MSNDISLLTTLPSLQQWLVERKWKADVDHPTWIRSLSYATDRLVKDIKIHDLLPSNDTVFIEALVSGTAIRPYHVRIRLKHVKNKWEFFSDCSCPVDGLCKHSTAVMALVSTQLEKISPTDQPQFSHDLREWILKIEKAANDAVNPPPVKPLKPEKTFLAYCIEKPLYHEALAFVLRVGSHQKDGSIEISDSRATADPAKLPKYMAPEDIRIAALYHQRYRNLRLWTDMPFAGDGWENILDAALETGRVFYGRECYRTVNEIPYRPITRGPALQVEATWEIMVDGSAKPILRCKNENAIIAPTHPLRYVDPVTNTVGLLESDLPPALLSAWSSGPSISPNNVGAVSQRFSAVSTAVLPTPSKVETETRAAAPPQPHLKIFTRRLGSSLAAQDFIVGQISFRYEDSPLLLPLAKDREASYAEIRNDKRIVWPRNSKAEGTHLSRLMKVGFIALSEVVAPSFVDRAGLYSCVPESPLPTPQLAWLALLESAKMQKLRESGWTIEIDPKAGLTAHHASEFFPAIETERDHGIDWFRFDISFQLNGKPVSLIPIIADAIRQDLPAADSPDLPEFITLPCENPEDGVIRFPARQLLEIVDQVRHLFHGKPIDGPLRIDRIAAAGIADSLAIDGTETLRALANLGRSLKNITDLPPAKVPTSVRAELRPYQQEGYRWLQFLTNHALNGILADDMGLGKTVQTLAHLTAECAKNPGRPSLVIAPTSVVPNWAIEAEKFTPHLKVLTLQGKDRAAEFEQIAEADIVFTSYPLLTRDFAELCKQEWHLVVLDEAQYIKNPKANVAQNACLLKAAHRLCLSGTPMENHLGELWSLMRFLMPGFLADEKTFNAQLRRPIERDRSADAQLALNRRVSPLILRRTKDQVATELPPKTEIIHGIDLNKKQTDLYESVRAAMDKRVRDAIASKGLAKSHIIVLDALLKLRQICCHPQLLKNPAAQKVTDSAKLDYLTTELLPTLIEEGRRILLFSTFTSMLALIEKHLEKEKIPFLKLTGQTQDRATLVKKFQSGEIPIFLVSLKAGGTGLNLTAADTVIHYDPWWNPAAENQATDRAHRIGQTKPLFVHKLVCRGTIEDRILDLQKHKSALVEALLSEETTKLKIDAETLSHLLSPLD
jgi:superfamily II DNA or RNA helicase